MAFQSPGVIFNTPRGYPEGVPGYTLGSLRSISIETRQLVTSWPVR